MQISEHPLGWYWRAEYLLFCIGHNLAVAGALEFYYRLGKAHADFELLRGRTPTEKTVRRTNVWG